MNLYRINNDIKVFGLEVRSFPAGIGDAFESLVNKIHGGFSRDYYGITFQDSSKRVVYLATAAELELGEAEKYECDRYTIERGDYVTETVRDWRGKTDSIRDVFDSLFGSMKNAPAGPCVEWYKDDNEMICMVKLS